MEDSNEDYSNFEEEEEGGEMQDDSQESKSLSEELEAQNVEVKSYQVLSKEDILKFSSELVSDIKAVCDISSSGASALLRRFELAFIFFVPSSFPLKNKTKKFQKKKVVEGEGN